MRTILIADEGYIYTNGSSYGTVVYLAKDEFAESYYQITLEAYRNLTTEEYIQEE